MAGSRICSEIRSGAVKKVLTVLIFCVVAVSEVDSQARKITVA
jgi:hypothetical protein